MIMAVKAATTASFFINETNNETRIQQKVTFIAFAVLTTIATDKMVRPLVNTLAGIVPFAGPCVSDRIMSIVVGGLCFYALTHALTAANFYNTGYDKSPKSLQEFLPMPMFPVKLGST